ncbi:MAG: winged helix-turn-helix transcriptional regulator, partial [Cycloclasticus sp.]
TQQGTEITTQQGTEITTQQGTEITTQEIIIQLLSETPSLTRKSLAERIGMTPDGVKYHLNKLKATGLIQHIGSTKAGFWKVLNK